MAHEDPGWREALRGLWWYLIPLVGPILRGRGAGQQENGLVALRSVYAGLIVPLFLFVVVLTFIEPFDGGDEGWVPWVVVIIGVVSVALIARFRRRPLVTTSSKALAGTYRAWFFIEIGLAEAAGLFGFVGVFLTLGYWVYLLGLAFALAGLWLAAPTRSDIERRQREISAAGSSLSLLDALIEMRPSGQPGGAPRT
jgi:hypothetical protein